jgi:Glycosyltransferase family 87
VMAVVARLMGVTTAAWWLSGVNIAICLTAMVAVLWTVGSRLSRVQLWTLALAMGVFMPALSSIWWKQFNLLALGAALVGWLFVRRGSTVAAGVLLGLSIAIKPLLILLPVLLLAKADLRRVGAWTVVSLGGLLVASRAFLAWRASDLAVLSPVADLRNFSDASRPENILSCHPENLSPGAYLCRLSGSAGFQTQRALVAVGVLLLAYALWEALSRRAGMDWAWFAAVCTLSPMVSPIAWTHYQVVLAPALVLLFLELASPPRSLSNVLLIGAAFAACALSVQPYGSLPGRVESWLGGPTETTDHLFSVLTVAALAQWIVLLLLFQLRGRPSLLGPNPGVSASAEGRKPVVR